MVAASTRQSRPSSRRLPVGDWPLLLAALALAVLGWVLIASVDAELGAASEGFAWRQAVYLGGGLLLGVGVYRWPLAQVERARVLLLLSALVLLSAVLIPGLGVGVNGTRRSLDLGPFRPQVSGPATLMILIFLAAYLARHGEGLRTHAAGFLRLLALLGLAAALLALEPQVRAAAILLIATMVLILAGGVRPWQLGAMAGLVVSLPVGAVLWSPYLLLEWLARPMSFWEDPFERGFALAPPRFPIDWGDWTGVGLGASAWEPYTLEFACSELVLRLLARELGLLGLCGAILLYGVVVWRAFAIARQAQRTGNAFAALLARGVGLWIGLPVLVHLVDNLESRVTRGWTLPPMSYGGINLAVFCVAVALLLRAAAETRDAIAAAPTPSAAEALG
jgi:cell division protein FtsW